MSGTRGEAAGVGGGRQFPNARLASAPVPNTSSIVPSTSLPGAVSRLTPSASDHSSVVRASNGLPNETTRASIADMVNNSSTYLIPSHLRTSYGMAVESGGLKRKLSDTGEDLCSRRKRIAAHKAVRLKRIQKQYVDHVMELLTLENVSLLSDVYRRRITVPALLNYFKRNPLDPSDPNEDLSSCLTSSMIVQQPESKVGIVGVPGLSPLAASTSMVTPAPPKPFQQEMSIGSSSTASSSNTLPSTASSSMASSLSPEKRQLPYKGCTPPSTTPVSQRSHTAHESSMSSQEQIVEKAKQEAHVMQRIGELQREGLWTEKRLPKVQEPPRTKAHWDYLIEEMVWLAADFAQERKWKKAAAKKCAKMVQKYFQDKELSAQKAVRSQELQLKRIASCMAKEVKQFWTNVEKLVEYKQQTRLEEKRKKALDQHLSFIVDQTEKYSSLVAESMNKTGPESVPHSVVSSRAPSPSALHHTSDVEFEPGGTSSDDEETIAKAEAEEEKEEGLDKSKEIELLQQESELPLEELVKDYLDNRENIVLEENEGDDDSNSAVG